MPWEEVNNYDRFKRLIELANDKILICTFSDKSIKEKVMIVVDNDNKIANAIKNLLTENKIYFEKIEDTEYDRLIILLFFWRTGFILKKSEIDMLEKALIKAGAKINKTTK